ncbi:hypothetical protein [Primorskyibacter sp. 2E233]|uniref:hypothetical protein n=1 Tax=Primorskyibacter sp. 2E233 TaxID=3413431 RepID=UPI003BF3C7AF
MKLKSSVMVLVLAMSAHTAHALDAGRYKTLVAETISGISSNDVDVVRMIDLQQQLIAMGVQGARAFAVDSPADATLMNFVADQADAMQQMTLDEIEAAWHDGEALEEIGLAMDALDHFGAQISHMDAIVHPATAIIALREYQATGKKSYLVQVKDELSEVVEHIGHLN